MLAASTAGHCSVVSFRAVLGMSSASTELSDCGGDFSESEPLSVMWERLPLGARRELSDQGQFPEAEVLDCACLDDEDRAALLSPHIDCASDLAHCVCVLKCLQARVSDLARLRRKRRAAMDRALQSCAIIKRAQATVSGGVASARPVGSLQWLLSSSGARKRKAPAWPSARVLPAGSRAAVELEQTQRWRLKFAQILIDANAPALVDVAESKDLQQCAVRLAGSSRFRTLKKHVQMWHRFVKWLSAAYDSTWPTRPCMILDFLEDLAAQPCGKSVPDAFMSTLAYMEKAAGVPGTDLLCAHPLVKKSAAQISAQLESEAPPPRKARPQPLLLLIALELWVVKGDAPRFSRALAWAKLVKFWSSCRSDDLAGLIPSSMTLDRRGLSAVLRRTKTTGPGKRVKWLPIFVDREASFSGAPWLEVGFHLWQQDGMNFDRDYLIPLPSADGQSCRRCMADYPAVSALSMLLYKELPLPVLTQQGWTLSDQSLLVTASACRAWSEHSERCWLTSVAALLGVTREQRDFLGRWRVVVCSDEYVRTAQHIVSRLQRRIVSCVLEDSEWSIRDIGLRDLELHLQACGESRVDVSQQLELLRPPTSAWRQGVPLSQGGMPLVHNDATDLPENLLQPEVDVSAVGDPEVAEVGDEAVAKYFVCITKNRRLRRLHRWGGCGTVPMHNTLNFEAFDDLEGVVYDAACKHCWKDGVVAESSSSSSESTDDDLVT